MTATRPSNQVKGLFRSPLTDQANAAPHELSSSELDVLHLMTEGLYDQQIAERLCIRKDVVADSVGSIVEKMGAHSRTEAAVRAFRQGIFTSEYDLEPSGKKGLVGSLNRNARHHEFPEDASS